MAGGGAPGDKKKERGLVGNVRRAGVRCLTHWLLVAPRSVPSAANPSPCRPSRADPAYKAVLGAPPPVAPDAKRVDSL